MRFRLKGGGEMTSETICFNHSECAGKSDVFWMASWPLGVNLV